MKIRNNFVSNSSSSSFIFLSDKDFKNFKIKEYSKKSLGEFLESYLERMLFDYNLFISFYYHKFQPIFITEKQFVERFKQGSILNYFPNCVKKEIEFIQSVLYKEKEEEYKHELNVVLFKCKNILIENIKNMEFFEIWVSDDEHTIPGESEFDNDESYMYDNHSSMKDFFIYFNCH